MFLKAVAHSVSLILVYVDALDREGMVTMLLLLLVSKSTDVCIEQGWAV